MAESNAVPNQVFIGGMSLETTAADLIALMAKMNVRAAGEPSLFLNAKGVSKGCALVKFSSEDAAKGAIDKLSGVTLNSKELFVCADRGVRPPRARAQPNEDKTFIYVGNLNPDVTNDDLLPLFSRYGTVKSCDVRRNRRRDPSTLLWATVQMSNEAEANAARAGLNGMSLKTQNLTLEPLRSLPRVDDRPREPRAPRAERAPRESRREPREPAASLPSDPAVLWVGNLSEAANEQSVTTLFQPYGQIISIDVKQKKEKVWAIVRFATESGAASAIAALNKIVVDDQEIAVQVRHGRRVPTTKESRKDERKPRRQEDEEGKSRRRPKREEVDKVRRPRKEPEPLPVLAHPECHLYVRNLSFDVSDSDLTTCFRRFGRVVAATVTVNDKGISRGWGAVEMGSAKEAQAALAADQEDFKGRPLFVRMDKRNQ